MAISFPSSPTNGQKFISGTVVYTYSTATGAWSAAPLGTALPDNLLVNPTMAISQQNAATSVACAHGVYGLDQWRNMSTSSTVGVLTIQQLATPATPFGSLYRMRATLTTASSTPIVRNHHLVSPIEGLRIANLKFGAAGASPVVVRFGIRGSAARQIDFVLRNGGLGNSFYKPFTMSTADQYFTFAIPGATVGTWPITSANGMEFGFSIAANSSAALADQWTLTSVGSGGTTNSTLSLNDWFEIFDCGLYADPNNTGKAPPWEYVPDGTAMMACQRYWYKAMNLQGFTSSATLAVRMAAPHPVTMRAAPTPTSVAALVYDATVNNAATQSTNYSNINNAEFQASSTGMVGLRAASHVGGAAAYFAMSARL